jgi:hypothetical protein
MKCRQEAWVNLEDRSWCPFERLTRRLRTVAKGGSDHPDRLDLDRRGDPVIVASPAGG